MSLHSSKPFCRRYSSELEVGMESCERRHVGPRRKLLFELAKERRLVVEQGRHLHPHGPLPLHRGLHTILILLRLILLLSVIYVMLFITWSYFSGISPLYCIVFYICSCFKFMLNFIDIKSPLPQTKIKTYAHRAYSLDTCVKSPNHPTQEGQEILKCA